MTSLRHALAATLVACAAAGSFAQSPGVYRGTTSQGHQIEITIGDDGFGNPLFAGISVPFTAICTEGNPKFVWWGIGTAVPIFQYPFQWEYGSDLLYEALKMKFNGNAFNGTIGAIEPAFVDVNSSKTRITRCASGQQTFSAALVPASAAQRSAPRLAPGQAMKLQ